MMQNLFNSAIALYRKKQNHEQQWLVHLDTSFSRTEFIFFSSFSLSSFILMLVGCQRQMHGEAFSETQWLTRRRGVIFVITFCSILSFFYNMFKKDEHRSIIYSCFLNLDILM